MFQNHYGIYAIAFLCFLLMLQNVFLVEEWRQGGGASYTHTYVNCGYEKIIARELQRWKKTDIFKVYTPKRSCFVCSNAPCIKTCDQWVNVSKMNIYNNLFEFGLFAFNLAQENIFRIIINNMCNFKVEITPNEADEKVTKTKIVISECLTDVLYAPENCTEKLEDNPPRSFNIEKDCIFVALAFLRPGMLHYSISFNCTVIPSLLLNENISKNITSKKCFIEKERKNQTAAFLYKAKRGKNVDGIALMLPCTSGGYAFDDQTGHIITGETCDSFMKDESNVRGLNFLLNELYDDNPSFIVESRTRDWDEIMANKPIQKLTPAYVGHDDKWIKQVDITRIIKNVTAPKKKARQDCKLVDAPETTMPPKTTATTMPPKTTETTMPPKTTETTTPPTATETVKPPAASETANLTATETAENSTATGPPQPPPLPPNTNPPMGLDNNKVPPNDALLKGGGFGGNIGKDTTKKRTTTEKPKKISGMGGASDTSRGSLHFLSIEIKLIILASNLGIIYHL
ncbi:UNVERIFIED_CONTAM: hypothetical protein RMT77_013867 [Armadillidium vulgare]